MSPQMGKPSEMTELPLSKERIASYSNHGIKPGVQGKASAKINQDRGQITYPLAGDRGMAMLCVYDGHGMAGEKVSEFAMLRMPDLIEAQRDRLRTETKAVLTEAFIRVDQELRDSPIPSSTSGSTGLLVLVTRERLWTACVGDSRAVLGHRVGGSVIAKPLTVDQKPDHPEEERRIISCGGYVTGESSQFGPARVWLRPGEGPGLAMARSIGDHLCAEVGVIAEPVVESYVLSPEDEILILASDGVWEFITNEEAMKIVSQHKDASSGCTALIAEATARWRAEEGNYRDDITATVVYMPLLPDPLDESARDEVAPAKAAENPTGYVPSMPISTMSTQVPLSARVRLNADEDVEENEEEGDDGASFAARRLTMANYASLSRSSSELLQHESSDADLNSPQKPEADGETNEDAFAAAVRAVHG